jgi:hypothetical protein
MNQENINSGKFQELVAKKEKYLADLRRLRYDYIDEIPDQILKPGMPNYYKYKCRNNFFYDLSLKISLLEQLQLLKSPAVLKSCAEFKKFLETIKSAKKGRISSDDIDKANKILDILIKELE